MAKTHKKCRHCDKEFKLYRTTDIFCSPTCSYSYNNDRQAPGVASTRKPNQRIKQISDKRRERLKGYSERDLFNDIWDERPHVSELSGKGLFPKGHAKWHWQFLHCLPKSTYPSMRLVKDNILLALPIEHENQTDYEVFNKRVEEMKQKVYMR